MTPPVQRDVHFWSREIREPPCGTLEDYFEWSDSVEDVTCEGCREALVGDGGDLAARRPAVRGGPADDHPAP